VAIETASSEVSRRPAPGATSGARTIRLAKPEEGEARGEVFHLLRALALVIGVTAAIGWMFS
jgi:hypothetical protein